MKKYLSLIKFSHTLFALPFAIIGFVLGLTKTGHFEWHIMILVLLCMVFARSAAMAFNRYLDRDIDALNPRTANREIPAGIISPRHALFFVIFNCVLFVVCSGLINSICLALSPIALGVILFYSYTKRFTALCHLVLGMGLGLAPIGAFIAVTSSIEWYVIFLGLTVTFWVAGFDIIYSLQDDEFDESNDLRSIPVILGRTRALTLARVIHGAAIVSLSISVLLAHSILPWWSFISITGLFAFTIAIFYQHSIVSSDDLSKVNLAFFTTNGVASVILGIAVILDFLM